jgi:hypothetical protein
MPSLMTSTLVHATLKDWTRAFDVAWIYALLHSVIAYSAESIYIRYKSQQVDKDSSFHPIAQQVLAGLPLVRGIAVGILKDNDHWHVDSTTATVILLAILGACIG